MRDLARRDSQSPEVRSLADSLGNAPGVESFLRAYWLVVPDPPEAEYIRAPRLQIKLFDQTGILIGDCDEAATLAASLLFALSWPCRLVAIRMPGDYEFSHVFAECNQIVIDPIVPLESMPVRGYAERMELDV